MTKSLVHEVDGIDRSFLIRWSTDQDIPRIHKWLKEEETLGVDGNFLCNWNLTEQCHQEGELLVLVDEADGVPVAYQWGQLLQPGILQVRSHFRGKGLGQLVVQHCVELALQKDEMVLQVECKPSPSVPFWKKMGFVIFEEEYTWNPKGYRVLSKQMLLPPKGVPKEVRVNLYPEERKWQENVRAIACAAPEAVLGDDGKVYLAERVSFQNVFRGQGGDPVVEILVDGEVIYRDKAKYQDAGHHGVRRCMNGFYVDTVTM